MQKVLVGTKTFKNAVSANEINQLKLTKALILTQTIVLVEKYDENSILNNMN